MRQPTTSADVGKLRDWVHNEHRMVVGNAWRNDDGSTMPYDRSAEAAVLKKTDDDHGSWRSL